MSDIEKLVWIAEKAGLIVDDYGSIKVFAGREYHVNESGEIVKIVEVGE